MNFRSVGYQSKSQKGEDKEDKGQGGQPVEGGGEKKREEWERS